MNYKQYTLLFLIALVLTFSLNACKLGSTEETTSEPAVDCKNNKYLEKMDKYKNAEKENYRIDIKTEEVVDTTNSIRIKLSQLKGSDIDSFSSNSSNGFIRMYIPIRESLPLDKILSEINDITSFSKNTSNFGDSYTSYIERYLFFKFLYENFDSLEPKLKKQYCGKVDPAKFQSMIKDNMNNNLSNINSYSKQLNKIELQINIIKKQG